MTSSFGLVLLMITSFGAASAKTLPSPANTPIRPVRIFAAEPGVVPTGSCLIIQTADVVSTVTPMSATIYTAYVLEDVVDQTDTVLIPKGARVELGVRSLPYLGPGGVGMNELVLEVRAVTVRGLRYPVATASKNPGAGGLELQRNSPKWVGGPVANVITSGSRIYVPATTLVAFQIDEPIRLVGVSRR